MTTYDPYQVRQSGFAAGGGMGSPLAGPSGIGGAADKSQGLYLQPTLIYSRELLNIAYNESWAFAAFIDYMVDDMFIRWREFEAEDESAAEAMQEQEENFEVERKLAKAMKAGRLYGTALLVISTRDGPPMAPLNMDRLAPGSLKNLFVVDRYAAEVKTRCRDINCERFGLPEVYTITLPEANIPQLDVHASRVLRFDGIEDVAPMSNQASFYDSDWGQSSLIRVATAVQQQMALAQGVTHLMQEASIAYIKAPDVRSAGAGQLGQGALEKSLPQLMEEINRVKSIYRMIALDQDEELNRLTVNFAGLAEILNQWSQYVAAAGGYPATRFLGMSPLGMNATGEGDMKNYVVGIEALRLKMLSPAMRTLDMIMAANAGLAEPPEYRWLSLFDMSDGEQAKIELDRVNAVVAADKYIAPEEARRALMETTEMFSFIDPDDVPEPELPELPQFGGAPGLPGQPGGEEPAFLEDRRMRPDPSIGTPQQRRFINRQVSSLYSLSRQMTADLQEAFEQLAEDVEEALRPHLADIIRLLPPIEEAAGESQNDSIEDELGTAVIAAVDEVIDNMRLYQWNEDYLRPIAEDYVLRSANATVQGLDLDFELGVNIPDTEMRALIEAGGTRMGLVDLAEDTKTALYHALQESRVLGLGMEKTAELIREQVPAGRFVNAGPDYRARLIARTEVRHGQVESAAAAYEASEVVERVTIYDAQLGADRSDPHCIARNGKEVTLAQARKERQDEHPNGTYMEAPLISPN